jgi:hypothetical protein
VEKDEEDALIAKIKAQILAGKAAWRERLRHRLRAGEALLKARALCKARGLSFRQFLKENANFGEDVARQYMALARLKARLLDLELDDYPEEGV